MVIIGSISGTAFLKIKNMPIPRKMAAPPKYMAAKNKSILIAIPFWK